MDSGSLVPAAPVDGVKAQAIYDAVVAAGGCSSAADTLSCLRSLSYEDFLNAQSSVPAILSYSSIALSYVPRPDGTVMVRSPEQSVTLGLYAPVPFIVGDQEDEGTIFALFQSNITTTEEIIDYLATHFFQDATIAEVTELVEAYPDDITEGSPFGTGILNNWYPQYKRLAALLGDSTFTLTRRLFLEGTSTSKPTVPSWSYLSSYDYGTAILGTFHASDILQVFYGTVTNYASLSMRSYYFNFAYNLDPNNSTGTAGVIDYTTWPQWSDGNMLLQVYALSSNLLADTFRSAQAAVLRMYTSDFRI